MNGGDRIQAGVLLTVMMLPAVAQSAPSQVNTFGVYVSHQVNVDASGQNIIGDIGNEPSIAINPLDAGNVVIGWRMFDPQDILTKKGGYGYSFDAGASWGNGALPAIAMQNRTDPVLDADSQGNFYYQSMSQGSVDGSSVFKSTDGGITWHDPVYQFIGDKNWLAIDRTDGEGQGNIYSTWRPGEAVLDPNYVPKFFIRSTDGGHSYQEPDVGLPISAFGFGRMAIGPNSEVYVSGINEEISSINAIGIIRSGHYFLKSTDAKSSGLSPTFTAKQVDMGGNSIGFYAQKTPNPIGGIGDLQIATDQSIGVMRGNIYMMAHVQSYDWLPGDDPLDVYFVRSSDGGETWSEPLRLNDDPPSAGSFQWFPMLGVAPNSRIDAVWYDTRNGSTTDQYRHSQLYYAYSWDGGLTWSKNLAVTPEFDTHLPYKIVNGQAQQTYKLGDYTQLVSDASGAHIAYTATYNGEQDVYYLNVFPDCNSNGKSDVLDIQNRLSGDTNFNHLPDSCENITVRGDLDGDRDVDQLDLNVVIAARNLPASGVSDPRDLDKNGVINVLDVRKLTLLCTRVRCAV
ncbi:hypothetical protein [Methylomonas albis]|uniref:Dockerin domain-containing protein n=1 Tax=Methylomonas albis TaxID=1854563 RepID=A0ABR9D5D7_9GAMM|nr:hypothetical protein [Methylomonas albis]MBD9357996.1 hypothetical protein [Methylomonas albis]